MRAWLVLLVASAALLPRGDARAICGRLPAAFVSPEPGTPAPLNTHVRVQLLPTWKTIGFCVPDARDDDETREACPTGTFDVALRQAPGAGVSRDEVLVTRRDSVSNQVATVELVPRALLSPRTRYEVLYVDRGGAVPTRIVGTFVTGDSRDDTAPSWRGVVRAAYSGRVPTGGARGIVTLLPECITPSVRFTAPEAMDDATPPDSLRFAIWMGDAAGTIDYASPPLVYERGKKGPRGFFVDLGGSESADSFAPPGRIRARFGLRAVDWAGNLSAPSEVTVVFR